MGHANLYIRKENEERWDALPDKSAWVNERLAGNSERSFPTPKPSPVKRDAAAFNKLKKDLDVRQEPVVYKPTGNWGA